MLGGNPVLNRVPIRFNIYRSSQAVQVQKVIPLPHPTFLSIIASA